MEELLVECMEVLEGEESICENKMKSYKVVSWAQVHQMPVAQRYLMLGVEVTAPDKNLR